MRGSAGRAVVPALVVLALLAVVAVAATGSTSTGTDRTRTPTALLDTLFSLGLLAVVAGGVLVAYGLMQRKDISREIASRRHRRVSLVSWILFVFVFTLVVYWRGWDFRPTQPPVTEVLPTGTKPAPSGTPPDESIATYEPRFAWIPVLVVLALVALAIGAFVASERRSRRRPAVHEDLVADVTVVLDETLDDLYAEADARRAVIKAYARLEQVLAAHGLPRRDSETEEEYLVRFLGSLEVSERAGRRLTELFEWARFSQHAIDAGMKEEAIGALEELRGELLQARETDNAARMEIGTGTVAT